MKKNIIYLLLLITSYAFSQKGYTKEFGIKNDNDLYTSTSKDRYYTNGIFLTYRYLSKKNIGKSTKTINKVTLAQQIYSPQYATVTLKEDHDRPFAGYLFGEFGISNFYQNNTLLNISSQIGYIGSNAFGEETMALVHNIWDLPKAEGWKYQISNAFALNFAASYIKNINKISNSTLGIDLITAINIGTILTNASTGINIRIGLTPLKNIINSIAYNGNLNKTNTKTQELFLYLKPSINYILYDATIQGSFLNDSSPITYQIKPLTFTTEFGISWAFNKINLGYSMFFHSKKLKSQNVPKTNNYGSIFINYVFK